jgi:hypothetical protein
MLALKKDLCSKLLYNVQTHCTSLSILANILTILISALARIIPAYPSPS